jgi:hypothetical protein
MHVLVTVLARTAPVPSDVRGRRRRDARVPRLLAAALFAITGSTGARSAGAQTAWFTPSFQPPTVATRDYTGAVVANAGTSALFQWREGLSTSSQLLVEGGLADAESPFGTKLLLGGQYAHQLARATPEQPLDLLLTAGAGLAVGEGPDLVRVPVGISIGHRFPLEGNLAITPYVHPRLVVDAWTADVGGDRTTLTIDFDIGASMQVTPQLAVRASLLVSGAAPANSLGLGLGLTVTPRGLRR